MRRRTPLRSRKRRDWNKMAEYAHTNSGGHCEICETYIPLGTAPAHIIPRSAGAESSDDSWNIAGLCIVPNNCHGKFDSDPAGFFSDWGKGTRLHERISEDVWLREYFEARAAISAMKKFLGEFDKDEGGGF